VEQARRTRGQNCRFAKNLSRSLWHQSELHHLFSKDKSNQWYRRRVLVTQRLTFGAGSSVSGMHLCCSPHCGHCCQDVSWTPLMSQQQHSTAHRNFPLPCKLLTSRRLGGRADKQLGIAAPEVVFSTAHSEVWRALSQKLGLTCKISNATGVTPAISPSGLLYTSREPKEKQRIRPSAFLSKGGFSLEIMLL